MSQHTEYVIPSQIFLMAALAYVRCRVSMCMARIGMPDLPAPQSRAASQHDGRSGTRRTNDPCQPAHAAWPGSAGRSSWRRRSPPPFAQHRGHWCCPTVWCLLFVLIRQGLRGGSGPQRLIRALGEEAGNPKMAFHRPSFNGAAVLFLHEQTFPKH